MTTPSVDGPLPIVFVHGIRVTGDIWHPVRARLESHVPTFAPDLPGHGHRWNRAFSLEAAVDAIAERIATQTERGHAMVAGHSLGGYVAMALAARHPEQVDGLVLAGCATNPMGLWGKAYGTAIALLSHAPPERLNAWSRWRFRRQFRPETAEPIVSAGFYSGAMRSAVASVVGRDYLQMLGTFAGPVRFVNGRRDWPFRLHESAFCRVSRHACVTLIERSGHLTILEHPERFADAVREVHRALSGHGAEP